MKAAAAAAGAAGWGRIRCRRALLQGRGWGGLPGRLRLHMLPRLLLLVRLLLALLLLQARPQRAEAAFKQLGGVAVVAVERVPACLRLRQPLPQLRGIGHRCGSRRAAALVPPLLQAVGREGRARGGPRQPRARRQPRRAGRAGGQARRRWQRRSGQAAHTAARRQRR